MCSSPPSSRSSRCSDASAPGSATDRGRSISISSSWTTSSLPSRASSFRTRASTRGRSRSSRSRSSIPRSSVGRDGSRPYNRSMLLAVDVGNTQTVLGLYEGERLTEDWRLATERTRTGDELGVLLGGLLDLDAVDGICLSSTVPTLIREWERLASRWAQAPILVVGPGVKTGIPIRYDDPREVGPDRIVNAVAAKERYGSPCIVVDFGTSTNFDVVSADGEYVGGVLAPGIEISMDALFARAARRV